MFNKKPLPLTVLLLVLLVLTTASSTLADATPAPAGQGRALLDQFQPRRFPNERPPRDDQVVAEIAGVEIGAVDAIDDWYRSFYARKEKSGPNPIAYVRRVAALQQAAAQGLSPKAAGLAEIGAAKILMIPFAFAGADSIAVCQRDLRTPILDAQGQPLILHVDGPGQGMIPHPALEGDNNTIWSQDFSSAWYQDLMFGQGVGVVRTDLNNGAGVDLSGISATRWYEEQSEGQYAIAGDIYPTWIQLEHSVAYYGWHGDELDPGGRGYPCGGVRSGFGFEFVIDVANKVNEIDPDFDWAQYDTDGDQIVDHFMLIHAGVDNSAGGGAYGNFQLWAHSWDVYTVERDDQGRIIAISYGYQMQGSETPDDPGDDIYVANYTHVPEDADIGVVVHEYGHDIGLPDYYDTSGATSNSTAQWINMSAGSWSGALGGTHPAPFNPWARYFLGWEDPVVIDYTAPAALYTIGQSEPTPAGTIDTLWIELPEQDGGVIPNRAGAGAGLHALTGNQIVHHLLRAFDLSAAATPVFSFDTWFEIEKDWDYAYVMASTNGQDWEILRNREGQYAASDPNLSLAWLGVGGLTGEYAGNLSYDLSAYAGSQILLRFAYVTDEEVQKSGIWVDNFLLADGPAILYSNDLENAGDWDNDGWEKVPYDNRLRHYYLLEWRNDRGSIASAGHSQQYYTLVHEGKGWLVDKFAANTPGLLIWYRNTFYPDNQALANNRYNDLPASGPKGEMLLVDSHFEPNTWSRGLWDPAAVNVGDPGVGNFQPGFGNRRAAMNGAFGLHPVPAWPIHDFGNVANPIFDFGSQPGVPAFHDSLGWAPGWLFPGGRYIYRIDQSSSVVIPAADEYSTRIRGLDAAGVQPGPDLSEHWGATANGRLLGPGNPGDDHAQFGLHIAVVEQAADGSFGVVKVWNAKHEVELAAVAAPTLVTTGDEVAFRFDLRNVGSAAQFIGYIPLPAGLLYIEDSVFGGLIPVGEEVETLLVAGRAGADLAALAAAGPEVAGFLLLRQLGSGAALPLGFAARMQPEAQAPIAATLTLFDNGYSDGAPLAPWRSVSSKPVALLRVDAGPDAVSAEGDVFTSSGAWVAPDAAALAGWVDYGDGSAAESLHLNSGGDFALAHIYAQEGEYALVVTLAHEQGGVAVSDSALVMVNNVPPTITMPPPAIIAAGETYLAGGAAADPGADHWTATVDYGDGSGPMPLALHADMTFALDHVYAAGGIYTVTVVVDDGAAASAAAAEVRVLTTVALPLTADAWVNTGDPLVNYNATAILTSRATGLDNILLTFDRSMLPSGVTIVDAELTLRNVANASGQLGKKLAATNVTPFNSTIVTGGHVLAGALSFFNPSAAVDVPLGPADMAVDVTAQIAAWAAGDSQLAVQTSGPAGRTNIGALESWPAGQAATLTVTYVP